MCGYCDFLVHLNDDDDDDDDAACILPYFRIIKMQNILTDTSYSHVGRRVYLDTCPCLEPSHSHFHVNVCILARMHATCCARVWHDFDKTNAQPLNCTRTLKHTHTGAATSTPLHFMFPNSMESASTSMKV
jgi:hypothetical protein